jgi:ATP-binding cassette subfamily B protein
VGIVGVSGSGKSTLTKLLMRLYDVQKGKILIDGQSICDITQESLHQSIALIPQDPVLFHRTLEENIRYAQPDISDKVFQKYCRIARCDTFIEKLPLAYKTLV